MNKIQKMLRDLCPNGVEWKTLGEVCEKICSGGTPTRNEKSYFEGTIPWMRTQEVDWKDVYDTEIKITEEAVANSSAKLIPANCVIIAMYGATAAKSCINKIPLTTNQACCNLQIDPTIALYRYVYYWVCNKYKELKALGEGSQNNINAQKIKSFPIPVPPIPIQAEIVNLLDKFTQLSAELKEELKLRRKQYDYYRNHLLSFDSNSTTVHWMPLGEVAELKAGKSISATQIFETQFALHKYPCFGGNGIRGYVDSFSHHGEFPIIGRQGALCGCVNYANGDFYATEHAVVAKPKGEVLSRFLFYMLQNADLNQYKTQGAQPGLSVTKLNDIVFPIPPIAEQERIVGILDKFETLVNDLSKGLPAEIALVQKQYEYYRNLLLTFE